MNLHRFTRHPFGGFANISLNHAGFHRSFAFAHHLGNRIAELSRALNHDGHASEFDLDQLIFGDVFTKSFTVLRIVAGCFVCGLHHANRARGSL